MLSPIVYSSPIEANVQIMLDKENDIWHERRVNCFCCARHRNDPANNDQLRLAPNTREAGIPN